MSFEEICKDFIHSDDEMLILSSNYNRKPHTRLEDFEDQYFNNVHKYAKFEDDINERYNDDICDSEYNCNSHSENLRLCTNGNNILSRYVDEHRRSTPSSDDCGNTNESKSDESVGIIYGLNDMEDTNMQENDDFNNIVTFDVNLNESVNAHNPDNVINVSKSRPGHNLCFDAGTGIITLDDILDENIKTKDKKLTLYGQHINKIPEMLKEFEWIEELIIKNTTIQSLENLPQKIITLTVEGNNIPVLDGNFIPESVRYLKFTKNNTSNVFDIRNGIIDIDLSYNCFSEIGCVLPTTLESLRLLYCEQLEKLPIFGNDGENLKYIDISVTNIKNIDNLPSGVTNLHSYNCPIITVSRLPKELVIWKTYKSKIKNICCEFPRNLSEFDIADSYLNECPDFNDAIKIIDLSSNMLKQVPKFPNTVETIDVRDNHFISKTDLLEIEKSLPVNVAFFSGNTSYSPIVNTHCNQGNQRYRQTEDTQDFDFSNSDMTDTNDIVDNDHHTNYNYGLGVHNGMFDNNYREFMHRMHSTNYMHHNMHQGAYWRNNQNGREFMHHNMYHNMHHNMCQNRHQSAYWRNNQNGIEFNNNSDCSNRYHTFKPVEHDESSEYSESNPHYIALSKKAIILE